MSGHILVGGGSHAFSQCVYGVGSHNMHVYDPKSNHSSSRSSASRSPLMRDAEADRQRSSSLRGTKSWPSKPAPRLIDRWIGRCMLPSQSKLDKPNLHRGVSSKFLAKRKRNERRRVHRACVFSSSLTHTLTLHQFYYRESRKQQQPSTMADKKENAAALEKKE